MNLAPNLEPDDDLARTQATEAYAESDACERDALDHVADADNLPDWLVKGIVQWYATTPKFADVVDDIMAGERHAS